MEIRHVDFPYQAGGELFTPASPWKLMRSPGVVDAAAAINLTSVDLSCSTFVVGQTNIDATNGLVDVWELLGYGVNAVQLAFFTVDDAADDDFDLGLYAWKESRFGPALPVYLTTGDACKVGTMFCAKHPTLGTTQASGKWVDTISGTSCWPTGVLVNDSGNNRICTISFDLMGCRYLYARLWNDGGALTAANVGTIITRF